MRLGPFLLLGAIFFAVVAAVAAIAGGISWAIPVALVAIIAAVYAGATRALGERERAAARRRRAGRHCATVGEGGLPKAHVIGDDETALGDTPEVHAEISPHDFPKGAPERQAGGADGRRRRPARGPAGHVDPSEREDRVRHPSRTRDG